jgi:hypothetical protein
MIADPTAIPAMAPDESEEELDVDVAVGDSAEIGAVLDEAVACAGIEVVVDVDIGLEAVEVCVVELPATVEYKTSLMGPAGVKVQSWPEWPQTSKKGWSVSLYVSKYTEFPSATFSIPKAAPAALRLHS